MGLRERFLQASAELAEVEADLMEARAAPVNVTNNTGPSDQPVKPKTPTFGLSVIVNDVQGHGTSFGTRWKWGDENPKHGEQGDMTAAHVVEEWPGGAFWKPGMDRSKWPEFTKKYSDDEIILRPGGLDVALFGVILPKDRPPNITVGMKMAVRGYPGGVTINGHYETRLGEAYLDRPEEFRGGDAPSWIIKQVLHDVGKLPGMQQAIVIGGMSGGCGSQIVQRPIPGAVQTKSGFEIAVAVLVTLNSAFPTGEKSHDIVELADVWDILMGGETAST